MRKNKLIVLTAILLSAVLTLTACNNGRNVPELVEPVGGQQTFRPVSRRNMGKMDWCFEYEQQQNTNKHNNM